jgi:hypothetical protein
LGDEVKELYEHSFAIHVKHEGLEGTKTSIISYKLGHYKLGHYYSQLAALPVDIKDCFIKFYQYRTIKNRFELVKKVFGSANDKSINPASDL